LHPLHWVRFNDQLNIFLKVILNNFNLHFLLIGWAFTLFFFASFFLRLFFFVFLFIFFWLLSQFDSLLLLSKSYICDILLCWYFLRKVSLSNACWSYKFNVKLLSENDIILEARLNLKIFNLFFWYISKLKHAIGDLLLKEGDFFLDTDPNALMPFRVVLFLLLVMGHEVGKFFYSLVWQNILN